VSLPLSILFAHLQTYYGYDALRPGQSAIVIVRTTADTSTLPSTLTLEPPSGLRVETPCVWAPSRREGAWRIAADRDGDYDLRVMWDGTGGVTKRVRVTSAATATIAREPVRPAARMLDEWLHPGEPPLPAAAPIEAITVTYANATIDIGGFPMPWVIVFLALTTLFMLVGRSFLQVVI
jgi:hypothetical protein